MTEQEVVKAARKRRNCDSSFKTQT